jgi:uroporphyrinogen-III synthase
VDCCEIVASFLNTLEQDAARMVIFLTGVGANVLFHEADRQGRLPLLVDALSRATVVCRGPKPAAALKRRGLSAAVSAREPYTSTEVLEALDGRDLKDLEVVLVHYGERHHALARQLHARGALVNELCLYQWQMPEDVEPMRKLIESTISGEVDAVVFTSQIQGRHLLEIAERMRTRAALIDALNSDVVVAAVGPVCRAALEEAGIRPDVVPANPKMGPLIAALADHYATTKAHHEDDAKHEDYETTKT